jgi:hypothetical protein
MVDALLALDRLNRAARAEARHVSTGVVYTLKDRAIEVLVAMGRASLRRVTYRSTCGVCGGTGWYRKPSDHHFGEECRTCDAAGRKLLRFIETTIALPETVRWHSPADKGAGAALWQALVHEPVGDPGTWTPRQPGKALSAAETAEALCDAEAWIRPTWLIPPPALSGYTLDLGDFPGPCDVCGTDFGVHAAHRRHERVTWTGRSCLAHVVTTPARMPAELDDPRVERWFLAHRAPPPPPSLPVVLHAGEVVTSDDEVPF